MRFLPVRDDALLVELDDLEHALALVDAFARDPLKGVTEIVPGARTLLVSYRPAALSPGRIVAFVRALDLGHREVGESRLVEIPTHYDGEDLADVADLLGVTAAEVVEIHTGSDYFVGFTGFAPGFAYLSGGHPRLDVPRRPSPRTRIPAGSVALAGTFSGVYPRESPGGWQLIGTTDSLMWDLGRDRPALLAPGDRVRFVDVTGSARQPEVASDVGAAASVESDSPALEVLSAGMLTLLEDLGRPGLASMGVSSSGALDPVSLRAANRLVGNSVDAACLEVTFGGLRVRARGDQVVAVTGAPSPLELRQQNRVSATRPFATAFALQHGDELVLGAPRVGVRSYLSVRGGFDLEPVLGSLSTDVLAGLGPAPVVEGAVLPVRPAGPGAAVVALHDASPLDLDDVVLDVVLGPRTDWFSADTVARFAAQTWTVTPQSNRVGLRLEGEPLTRLITDELPSEGTVAGALQVPPSGQPVLFLADHPLTGGYPIIGAVASYHLARAGQLPPGARVRFTPLRPFDDYTEASR